MELVIEIRRVQESSLVEVLCDVCIALVAGYSASARL